MTVFLTKVIGISEVTFFHKYDTNQIHMQGTN